SPVHPPARPVGAPSGGGGARRGRGSRAEPDAPAAPSVAARGTTPRHPALPAERVRPGPAGPRDYLDDGLIDEHACLLHALHAPTFRLTAPGPAFDPPTTRACPAKGSGKRRRGTCRNGTQAVPARRRGAGGQRADRAPSPSVAADPAPPTRPAPQAAARLRRAPGARPTSGRGVLRTRSARSPSPRGARSARRRALPGSRPRPAARAPPRAG